MLDPGADPPQNSTCGGGGAAVAQERRCHAGGTPAVAGQNIDARPDLGLPANGSGHTSRARRRRTHVPPPQRLSGESGFSLSDQCPPPGCCSVCPTHVRMRPHSRCKGPRPPPGCCSVWSGPTPLDCACRARRSTASPFAPCGADSCSPREATALFKRSSSVRRGAGPSVPRPLFPSWMDTRSSFAGGARWAAQALGARGSSPFPRAVRRRLPS
jgi:hypothetical protein